MSDTMTMTQWEPPHLRSFIQCVRKVTVHLGYGT